MAMKNRGGGRVGDNDILNFLCSFWAIFSISICKVSQFIDFFTGWKALQSN